ncbi:MAG: hypothetical protein WCF18_15060 [Chthoniobacteraceae bacterium]
MNGILAILAIAGLIIALIGRWMVGAEARNISLWWLWALRLLPLAEIMFLARYWEVAKTGAFTSLIGIALILPWGAKTAWDIQHVLPEKKPRFLAVLNGDQKNAIFTAVQREQEEQITREQDRLQKLNVHMADWFQQMQTRRGGLRTPEEVAAFNDEAAAYKCLHAVTRAHAAKLAELQATKLENWSQVTEELAREHLFGAKAMRQPRK